MGYRYSQLGNVIMVEFGSGHCSEVPSLADLPADDVSLASIYLSRFEEACTAEVVPCTPREIYNEMVDNCDSVAAIDVVWDFQDSLLSAARVVAARFAGRCLVEFFSPGMFDKIALPFRRLLADESYIVASQAWDARKRYMAAATDPMAMYRRQRELRRLGKNPPNKLSP